MERTTLYENDLTDERDSSPVAREEQAHTMQLDPDIDDDEDDEDDDDDEDDESEDLDD